MASSGRKLGDQIVMEAFTHSSTGLIEGLVLRTSSIVGQFVESCADLPRFPDVVYEVLGVHVVTNADVIWHNVVDELPWIDLSDIIDETFAEEFAYEYCSEVFTTCMG